MNSRLKEYTLGEIDFIKIMGRNNGTFNPLTLFWNGSGLELNVSGSELWVKTETDYSVCEQWICIFVNGSLISRRMLNKGFEWICVFRGMNPENIKNVVILKEIQPMRSDPDTFLNIHNIKTDGSFHQIPDRKLKIEFIGDSVTSGEGLNGSVGETDWTPMNFGISENYVLKTAKALNADYRMVSQSGWGVVCGWDNNPYSSVPSVYDKICGVVNGEHNLSLHSSDLHDFSSWVPDFIIVSLGTNDAASFSSPAWFSEDGRETFKNEVCPEHIQRFKNGVTDFIRKIRSHNKNSRIIWVYGTFDTVLLRHIYSAVEDYVVTSGDENVSFLQLPIMTDDEMGSLSHPGPKAHKKISETLVNYIEKLL